MRILRVARFAARYRHPWDSTIAPETMDSCGRWSTMAKLTRWFQDRVWKETERALTRDARLRVYSSRQLRACGALRVLFPEVDALFGVPQPERWHPEIDTGVHVMMVLDQAEKLSPDLEVRFAALVHDLGKATTDPRKLAEHPGHEKRGVKIIRSLCQSHAGAEIKCRDLAILVAEYHTHCHRAFDLRPSTILRVLESTDAFRRPERFEQFLLTCEAECAGSAQAWKIATTRRWTCFVVRSRLRSAVDAAAIAAEIWTEDIADADSTGAARLPSRRIVPSLLQVPP